MKVKIDNEFVPVVFHNFSGSGVLFESHVPFKIELQAGCVISIPQSLSRDIAFAIRVKHCEKKESSFLVGAAIEPAADATWVNIIREIHDFITQRQGDIY